MGDHNTVVHKNSILLGSGLTSEEDGEIVLGNSDNNIRFKPSGQIVQGDKIVEVDPLLIKNLDYIFRQTISTILSQRVDPILFAGDFLYYMVNPDTNMDVPNDAYLKAEKALKRFKDTGTTKKQ